MLLHILENFTRAPMTECECIVGASYKQFGVPFTAGRMASRRRWRWRTLSEIQRAISCPPSAPWCTFCSS